MSTVRRPISLVKAATPDMTEVEIWRCYNSLPKTQRREVLDRVKTCSDPILRARANKLLRASYVL